MALSQCLEDLSGPRQKRQHKDIRILYNEIHRLALEELVSGGKEAYFGFLNKEKIPSFLSDDEIRCIAQSTVVPKSLSVNGEDTNAMEQSMSNSTNCSSVTYFPDVSDVEPPELEIGWPVFMSNTFRGDTQAVAHFQPSYGECIYRCKEAARRMIKSAKELIAIVTDSLTDLDIFKDLLEACTQRWVPVYILLDESCIRSFLQMCKNLGICLESLQWMRARMITGATYFMRSGVKIVGKVNERFMLVDGNRVATGSYRFSWTDGKLNSSNLIELSGKITEDFDEEFRILYAQSLPFAATQVPAFSQDGSVCDRLLFKQSLNKDMHCRAVTDASSLCRHTGNAGVQEPSSPKSDEDNTEKYPHSDASTTVMEEDLQECGPVFPCDGAAAGLDADMFALDSCSFNLPLPCVCKKTSLTMVDGATQTNVRGQSMLADLSESGTQTGFGVITPLPGVSDPEPKVKRWVEAEPSPRRCLKDRFQGLAEERQHRYARIRSKLDHVVTLLSSHCEPVELANMTYKPHLQTVYEEWGGGSNLVMSMTRTRMPARNRLKCLR